MAKKTKKNKQETAKRRGRTRPIQKKTGRKSSTSLMKKWEFAKEHLTILPLTVADLNLAEYAKSAAEKLASEFPSVVFTSGRRNVSEQASAMAANIVKDGRDWIKKTYAQSAERDSLQDWVDNNPLATTKADIAAGLESIMNNWTDSQKVKLSRHFAGLAFDVQPIVGDDKLKDAIKALPNLTKFLDKEGGLVVWHAEFKSA